jgi:hypothetical protein
MAGKAGGQDDPQPFAFAEVETAPLLHITGGEFTNHTALLKFVSLARIIHWHYRRIMPSGAQVGQEKRHSLPVC